MNIEDCKKEDGLYYLLQCKDYLSEFELKVKNGEEKIYEIVSFPFSRKLINDNNISLKCDLYESNDWFNSKDEKFEDVEVSDFSSGRRR